MWGNDKDSYRIKDWYDTRVKQLHDFLLEEREYFNYQKLFSDLSNISKYKDKQELINATINALRSKNFVFEPTFYEIEKVDLFYYFKPISPRDDNMIPFKVNHFSQNIITNALLSIANGDYYPLTIQLTEIEKDGWKKILYEIEENFFDTYDATRILDNLHRIDTIQFLPIIISKNSEGTLQITPSQKELNGLFILSFDGARSPYSEESLKNIQATDFITSMVA